MAPKKIILKGDFLQKELPLKASVDITPGMLCEPDTGTIKAHATAGGNASPIFAMENPYIETASGTKAIDTDYDDDGEAVFLAYCYPGAEVYAWLADGEDIAADDVLESDGAGALQAHTPQAVDEGGSATYTIYAKAPVCRALEAVDNSAGGAIARIKVEVL